MKSRLRYVPCLLLTASLSLFALPTQASDKGNQEASTFTANMVDTANAVPGVVTTFVRLHIDDFNNSGQISEMLGLLENKGQNALRDNLEDKSVGWIRFGSQSISYRVALATKEDTEDGRIVRAVVVRPLGFEEVLANWRSTDYPFTVVELMLDEQGSGSGALILATKLEFDGEQNQLIVESYGTKPMLLLNARTTMTSSSKDS